MEEIINQIINNERLIELYSCEQCNGSGKYQGGDMRQCNDCNGKGYLLDKDNQTLSIIGELIRAQECLKAGFTSTVDPEMKFAGLHLSRALIKIVELAYSSNINLTEFIRAVDNYTLQDVNSRFLLITKLLCEGEYSTACEVLLSICNSYSIDLKKQILDNKYSL